MKGLAEKLNGNVEKWGLIGLLHDGDYEETKENNPHKNHVKLLMEWLSHYEVSDSVKNAILAHGWKYTDNAPQPKTKMDWALYTCDELTGLIVAVALVKGGELAEVSVESVMKKWKNTGFAAGANREQIALCEERLDIPIPEFVGLALSAMQSIAPELGL